MVTLEYSIPSHNATARLVPSQKKGEYNLHVIHDKGTIKKLYDTIFYPNDTKKDDPLHLNHRATTLDCLSGILQEFEEKQQRSAPMARIMRMHTYCADNSITFASKDHLKIRPSWEKLELKWKDQFKKLTFPPKHSLKELHINGQIDIEGDPKDCHIEIISNHSPLI